MKFKKLLALLLACIMLCGMFVVIPVTAEEAGDATVETPADNGYVFKNHLADTYTDWVKAPTVEGFDAQYTVISDYAITTNKTYDLTKSVVRLNSIDVEPAKGHSLIITISPDNYDTFTIADDVENGKITIVLDFSYSQNSLWVYSLGYKDQGFDKVIKKADNYEITFSKSVRETLDDMGFPTETSTQYVMRINDLSIIAADENHWLAKLMNSESFTASNVTIATGDRAKFNATIEDYAGFTTTREIEGEGTGMESNEAGTAAAVVTGSTDDGYSVMSLDGKIAATTHGFDFTDKTLSIRPTWGIKGNRHNFASAMSITFAADRQVTKKAASGEDALCLLFGPNDRDDNSKYYKLVSVSNKATGGINPWQETGGEAAGTNFVRVQTASYNNDPKEYSLPEEYNISFVSTGANKWALVINGTYYEHDAINAFCNSGNLEDACVTIAGASGVKASCKVIDRKVNDWVDSQKSTNAVWFTRTTKNADGTDKYLIYKNNIHTTAERVKVFETTVDFTFDISTYNPAAFKITFSNEYGNATLALADAAAKEDTLMFYVKNTYLAPSDIYWLGLDATKTADGSNYKIPGWSDSWSGVTVREKGATTTNLKFNFYKEADGTYSIYINQKRFSSVNSEKLKNFCEKYADNGVFVSIASTNDDRTVCTPVLKKTATSADLAVANVDVANNTLKNVAANTTVADLKANATVGKYYGVSVVNANGEAVADDAVIGSGYKLVIKYYYRNNGTDVVSVDLGEYNIIVLGDTDGNAAVDANDITNVKKKLLGVNANVYADALDVSYDSTFNILDYVAIMKAVA